MKMFRFCLICLLLVGNSVLIAQETINQYDASGQRHGVWKKYFEGTDQLRYEGTFDHGKEVGVFKFYCESCKDQPMVVKEFTGKNGYARVTYFTKKGNKVSEGGMQGKLRVGEWLFFHEHSDALMSREHYVNGTLHGEKITYYPNGQITESLTYEMGIKEGAHLYYSPQGILLKKLVYHQDQLHGPATYYDAHGAVVIEGHYKKGKKNGLWKYYKEGVLELEERYPKPKKG